MSGIPKLLFQVWYNTCRPPKPTIHSNPAYAATIKRQLTDGWTYKLYEDDVIIDFFKENPDPDFPDIIGAFNRLGLPQHKSDLFRYYHIYVKGGFYMDSDAMIFAPIDRIVKDYEFVCVMSTAVKGSFFQGVIGAAPKNPIIRQALTNVYRLDPTALVGNFHFLCQDIHNIYMEYAGDKSHFRLYDEQNYARDIVDTDDNTVIFRHYWNAKDSIPMTALTTNLVYMAVFHNKQYIELLKILMIGVKFFTDTTNIDFLVMTTEEFIPAIQELSVTFGIPILIKLFGFTSMHESSCARLYIYDYENIDQYEKLLYTDTDVTVQGDLAKLFAIDTCDKIYALSEGTIEHEYHGGWFFDFSSIDKDTPGMNAGIMLFKNTPEIRELFKGAAAHIETRRHSGEYMPACLDQPFMNYHIIKAGKQNTNDLKNFAMIYCYDPPPPPSAPTTVSLCHFVWPLGNATHKRDRMIKHMDHIYEHYPAIYNTAPPAINPVLGQSYEWASGAVTFEADGKLVTPWVNGAYRWLDHRTLIASWSIYSHVLRFNDSYTGFLSVRKGDALVSVHRLRK